MKKLIFKHRSHSSEKVILFVQFRAVLSLRCGAGFSLAAASRLFPSCSAQSNPVASRCRARGAGPSGGAAHGLGLRFPGSGAQAQRCGERTQLFQGLWDLS